MIRKGKGKHMQACGKPVRLLEIEAEVLEKSKNLRLRIFAVVSYLAIAFRSPGTTG